MASFPRLSFEKSIAKQQFDLAKLLDPFEKLEMEFEWDDVTPLRPPSAFGGHQSESKQQSSNSGEPLGPPPSFSRLPPDGHEFPQEYIEPSVRKLCKKQQVIL